MDATNSNAPQGQRQTRKSWLVTWTLGLFFGWFGADRFYVGDTARAMLKALTCGACGIWWFVDLVEIYYGRFRLADVRLSNTDQQETPDSMSARFVWPATATPCWSNT